MKIMDTWSYWSLQLTCHQFLEESGCFLFAPSSEHDSRQWDEHKERSTVVIPHWTRAWPRSRLGLFNQGTAGLSTLSEFSSRPAQDKIRNATVLRPPQDIESALTNEPQESMELRWLSWWQLPFKEQRSPGTQLIRRVGRGKLPNSLNEASKTSIP